MKKVEQPTSVPSIRPLGEKSSKESDSQVEEFKEMITLLKILKEQNKIFSGHLITFSIDENYIEREWLNPNAQEQIKKYISDFLNYFQQARHMLSSESFPDEGSKEWNNSTFGQALITFNNQIRTESDSAKDIESIGPNVTKIHYLILFQKELNLLIQELATWKNPKKQRIALDNWGKEKLSEWDDVLHFIEISEIAEVILAMESVKDKLYTNQQIFFEKLLSNISKRRKEYENLENWEGIM